MQVGRLLRVVVVLGVTGGWLGTGVGVAGGMRQQAATALETPEMAVTRVNMTLLRDAFVAKLKAEGFACPIAPPKILVEDVPSLGQYNDETNTLRTADWTLLNPQERAFMTQLAGPGAGRAEVRVVFEKAAHQWIFVHEMGHWWQACQGLIAGKMPPWQVESGANRISLAYWRGKDPSVVTLMDRLFHQVLDTTPSPVPAGESVEAYFNKNYETLGPSPMYPWFQSKMNMMLWEESPAPSLKQVLAETK